MDFNLEEDTKLSSGEKNALKFSVWVDSKVPLDEKGNKVYHRDTWLNLVNPKTSRLNRGELATAVNIGKSALRQNPDIAAKLEELESDLVAAQILPELTENGKAYKSAPRMYDQGETQRLVDSKRLAELEEENQRLKAELSKFNELKAKAEQLKEELKRFEDLSEVLGELGIGDDL